MDPPFLRIITEIIIGTFSSPPILTYYVVIQLALFVGFMIAAYIMYPKKNHYSIMDSTMSFLGSPDEVHNPHGYFFFNIGIVWKMITNIPLTIFMFRHLVTFSIFGAYVVILFYGIGILSGIIVGLFPDKEEDRKIGGNFFKDLKLGMVHNIAAILSFGSSMLANFAIGLIYIFNPYIRSISQWLPPVLIYFGATVGMFWAQIKWQLKLKSNQKLKPWPGEGIFSLPMWEWTLYLSFQVFIYWMVFII
ncbi:MAG: hypothetical protein JW776_10595 [Candidatus Lokiarchaeota archaeon]|nr:hypothetical protein [Candidatus Lokiarchaeota archaeon]